MIYCLIQNIHFLLSFVFIVVCVCVSVCVCVYIYISISFFFFLEKAHLHLNYIHFRPLKTWVCIWILDINVSGEESLECIWK